MKKWYLLYCKRSDQERAIINLERQEVLCFNPKMPVEKVRRGKIHKVDEPFFPTYLFVFFDPKTISFTTIRSTRGVSSFVSIGINPIEVSEKLIVELRAREASFIPNESLVIYAKGESVELMDGEYKGLDAIFKEPDGEKRSFLFITALNKSTQISVDNASIRRK